MTSIDSTVTVSVLPAKPVTTVQTFSWIEWLIVPALIGLQLLILGDPIPFTHSFWLDEIHTQLLVEDSSVAHAATALAHGVDFNPPTYYGLARLISGIGPTPEVSQRAFSLACVIFCCLCVYRLVRDRCSPIVATAAALLIWSFEVVQTQAFESRFYAPWLAATALTALCLQRNSMSPNVVWKVGLIVSSTLMCTVHYFGVISLGLLAGTQLVKNVVTRRGGVSFVIWLAPAILGLSVCIATFYSGQRSALSVATWVPAISWKTSVQFLQELVPVWAIPIAFVVWLLARRPVREPSSEANSVRSESGVLAAIGLSLMPVCLILFSVILQPSLVSRYGTVCTIGFAIMIAGFLRPTPKWVATAFTVWFFIAGLRNLGTEVDRWHRTEERQKEMIARLRQVAPDVPLLFESRHTMYPITRYAPDLAPRIHFLALSNENLRNFVSVTPFRVVERDVAVKIEEFYPVFQTYPHDKLKDLPKAILIAFRQRKDFGRQLEGFTVAQLQPQIYEIKPLAPDEIPEPHQKPSAGESVVGNK